jgi:hypothetical protein
MFIHRLKRFMFELRSRIRIRRSRLLWLIIVIHS